MSQQITQHLGHTIITSKGMDKAKVTNAINSLYACMRDELGVNVEPEHRKDPKIIFYNNHRELLSALEANPNLVHGFDPQVCYNKLRDFSHRVELLAAANLLFLAEKYLEEFPNVDLSLEVVGDDQFNVSFSPSIMSILNTDLETFGHKGKWKFHPAYFQMWKFDISEEWFEKYNQKLDDDLEKKVSRLLFDLGSECGMILPGEDVVLIAEPFSQVKWLTSSKRPHNESGPAIEWNTASGEKDGLYALNGIRVPAYLVNTSADKLDAKQIFAEANVDVRAEGIRKMGIDRLLDRAELLDSYKNYSLKEVPDFNFWEASEYELYDLYRVLKDLLPTNIKSATYLKMKNQSTGIYHCEGVVGDKLPDAMSWRDNETAFGTYRVTALK